MIMPPRSGAGAATLAADASASVTVGSGPPARSTVYMIREAKGPSRN